MDNDVFISIYNSIYNMGLKNMTKEGLVNFRKNNIKYSTEEANKLLEKKDGLTFEEIQERDNILTFKRLQEESLKEIEEK